jgi:hypothetical protein
MRFFLVFAVLLIVAIEGLWCLALLFGLWRLLPF